MLDDKNNSTNKKQDNRNLSDVFKELQEIRYSQSSQINNPKPNLKQKFLLFMIIMFLLTIKKE